MQLSIKGNGNLVRVSGVSSYPEFELTGLYCIPGTVYVKIALNVVKTWNLVQMKL